MYMARGKQTKGMSPLCVSYYHMSPDLMGLTAISTITAQFPVRGRHTQTQQSFGMTQVTQAAPSKIKKWPKETLSTTCCRVWIPWPQGRSLIKCFQKEAMKVDQTDVKSQNPEEIRCNSIWIPLPLKIIEQQRPHVHSCPHTCYHMLMGNVIYWGFSYILTIHQNLTLHWAVYLCIVHCALLTAIFSTLPFHSPFFLLMKKKKHFLILNCH